MLGGLHHRCIHGGTKQQNINANCRASWLRKPCASGENDRYFRPTERRQNLRQPDCGPGRTRNQSRRDHIRKGRSVRAHGRRSFYYESAMDSARTTSFFRQVPQHIRSQNFAQTRPEPSSKVLPRWGFRRGMESFCKTLRCTPVLGRYAGKNCAKHSGHPGSRKGIRPTRCHRFRYAPPNNMPRE